MLILFQVVCAPVPLVIVGGTASPVQTHPCASHQRQAFSLEIPSLHSHTPWEDSQGLFPARPAARAANMIGVPLEQPVLCLPGIHRTPSRDASPSYQ